MSTTNFGALRLHLRTALPWLIPALMLTAASGVMLFEVFGRIPEFSYALDDAYIHMAVAKNLVRHGVWGNTPFEFSTPTSSLLWPLLIAISFALNGVSLLLPLALNLLSAVFLAWSLDRMLRLWTTNPVVRAVSIMSAFYFGSTMAMMFSGMEHVLQAGLTALALSEVAKRITGTGSRITGSKNAVGDARFYSLFVLLGMIRLEALILGIAMLALYFPVDRKRALFCLTALLFPMIIFGLISLANGWYFLPNSILTKTLGSVNPNFGHGLSIPLLERLRPLPYCIWISLGLVPLMFARLRSLGWRSAGWRAPFIVCSIIIILGSLLQWTSGLSAFDHKLTMMRYETYLITVGVAILLSGLWSQLADRTAGKLPGLFSAAVFLLLLAHKGLAARGYYSAERIPTECQNIYEQQVQMGRFVKQSRLSVAVNDIGAVSFFSDSSRVLDLEGLASREVFDLKLHGAFAADAMSALVNTRHIPLVMIYPEWFKALPADWVPLRTWRINNNLVAASSVVHLFATSSASADSLEATLSEFERSLPRSVEVAR